MLASAQIISRSWYVHNTLICYSEILDELTKLKMEEREVILHRIEELDDLASPEMLAAIDQADASPGERDISVEAMHGMVKSWACDR